MELMVKWYVKALMIAVISVIMVPAASFAGGYYLTDREGRIISEDSGKTVVIGPADKTAVLNDRGDRKVFDLEWNAGEKTLVVKGEKVHIKIYSSGKIERWTSIDEGNKADMPIVIQPIIPLYPGQKNQGPGTPGNTTK